MAKRAGGGPRSVQTIRRSDAFERAIKNGFFKPISPQTRRMGDEFANAMFDSTKRLDTRYIIDLRSEDTPTEKRVKKMTAIGKSGAFAGDGRDERPAPRLPKKKQKARAGSGESLPISAPKPNPKPVRPVRKIKPKSKPRRIVNQGRHDG